MWKGEGKLVGCLVGGKDEGAGKKGLSMGVGVDV
jgi:hypothetical protein